jgi:hypothetical protein
MAKKKKVPRLKRKRRPDVDPDSLAAALNWQRLGQMTVEDAETGDEQRDSKGSEE